MARTALPPRALFVLASWCRADHDHHGHSYRQVGRTYGLPRKQARALCHIGRPTPTPTPRTRPDLDPAAIRAEYEAGAPLHQLRTRYRTGTQRVRDAITSAGGTIHPRGPRTRT